MRLWIALVLSAALALPVAAHAAFPGSNPDESVRLNTPDDPDFDRCENDDAQGQTCTNVFDEEYYSDAASNIITLGLGELGVRGRARRYGVELSYRF